MKAVFLWLFLYSFTSVKAQPPAFLFNKGYRDIIDSSGIF
jgi:hypothetical protein